MSQSIEAEIIEQVRALSPEQQQRLLEFARLLASAPPTMAPPIPGAPGSALLHFAGTIPAEELQQMTRALEEQCERVDAAER